MELVTAIGITLVAACFHIVFAGSAGPLWRDEVNSVNIANLSCIGDVWRHIEFDSFPFFWPLLLRGWTVLTGGGDLSFRILGSLIGCVILGALWFNARSFKGAFPIFSVVLLGCNATMLVWGDSMRGYGLGIALILFTFGLVWRVIETPNYRNVALATVVAVLAVQTLYYNACLLFAICTAGGIVLIRRRAWRQIWLLLFIGGIPAISLLPYMSAFSRSAAWTPMFQFPELWRANPAWFLKQLYQTLIPTGRFVPFVWVFLLLSFLVFAIWRLITFRLAKAGTSDGDRVLFCATALVVGIIGYYLFLKRLQYLTQHWYYLALLAFIALAIDRGFSWIERNDIWKIVLSVLGLVFATLTFSSVFWASRIRLSNLDLIAKGLKMNADPSDVIIVHPWYLGITFARYYHGTASWTTIPPINDHRYARVDILRDHMIQQDQTQPVRPILQQIEEALQQGHRVWLVGTLDVGTPVLRAAPDPQAGWHDGPYYASWSAQVRHFLTIHAQYASVVKSAVPSPVNRHECPPLLCFTGWRDPATR